jgi:hypothetical protein
MKTFYVAGFPTIKKFHDAKTDITWHIDMHPGKPWAESSRWILRGKLMDAASLVRQHPGFGACEASKRAHPCGNSYGAWGEFRAKFHCSEI